MRHLGISQSNLANDENLVFVVKKCEIDYIYPARLDDVIYTSVAIKEIRGASIIMQQTISKDVQILCNLEVVIVCVDRVNFKATKIPNKIKSLLLSYD